jgi:hypothetical protein
VVGRAHHDLSDCGLLSGLSPTSPLVVRWGRLEGDTPERIEASTASQATGVNTVKASSFILIFGRIPKKSFKTARMQTRRCVWTSKLRLRRLALCTTRTFTRF